MKAVPAITFSEACTDPNLFGDWFTGPTFDAWRVVDKALFGEPLDAAELSIFTEITGRTEAPTEQATEAWIVVGRRGGKDVKVAALGAYLATIGADLFGFRRRLKPGERGVVQVLAVDRDQAKVCFGYLRAMFDKPLLRRMVKQVTADAIELNNGLGIEITTNDTRRVRGRTVIAAIFDEVAHWRGDDSANPDEAVLQAVKPAMATMSPHAMLVGISSPHAKSGLLYRKWKAHYGKPGPVLVVQAPTWRMNPTVARESDIIIEAYESDPAWARAEYGAQFRADLAAFIDRDVIEKCVDRGVDERVPDYSRRYVAFVDPSGGTGDSMTLAIAHVEARTVVLDLVREIVPPFSPEAAVAEFADILQRYRCSVVFGDNYGALWVQESFQKCGVFYQKADRPKSALYLDFLPIANSRAVSLLDHPKSINQFVALERRTQRGARDSVDHPRGAHDDVANAIAGVVSVTGRFTDAIVKRHLPEPKLAPGIYGMPDGTTRCVPPPPEAPRTGRLKI